jgi:hypothetical protein
MTCGLNLYLPPAFALLSEVETPAPPVTARICSEPASEEFPQMEPSLSKLDSELPEYFPEVEMSAAADKLALPEMSCTQDKMSNAFHKTSERSETSATTYKLEHPEMSTFVDKTPAADLESVRHAARIERAAMWLADNPPSSTTVFDLLEEGFGCSRVEAHEAVILAGRMRMLRSAFS